MFSVFVHFAGLGIGAVSVHVNNDAGALKQAVTTREVCMIKTETISADTLRIIAPEKLKADDFRQIAPQIESLMQQH